MAVLAGSIYLVSTAVFAILGIMVGVRLLRLSRRTHQVPERSLGLALALTAGLGYGLLMVGTIWRRTAGWDQAPDVTLWIIGLGWVFHNLGVSFMLDFVRRVFRPGEAWAGVLQIGLNLALWGSWLLDAFHGGIGAAEPGTYYWICFSVIGTYPLWTAVESFHYWGMMRKRVKLGLADPLVANRFLLWSIASFSSLASIWTVEIPSFLGYTRMSPEAINLSSFTMVGTSIFGIATICTYWLTFFPPAWYRARFESPLGSDSQANH